MIVSGVLRKESVALPVPGVELMPFLKFTIFPVLKASSIASHLKASHADLFLFLCIFSLLFVLHS